MAGETPILVDDEDYELVTNRAWHISLKKVYQGKPTLYVCNPRGQYLHRVIARAAKGQIVDHINGDYTDNRRSNLRICTHSQNQGNRKSLNRNNTTGYRGIAQLPSGRWCAHIKRNRRKFHLGVYATPEEAARAYDKAALDHYGEFAVLNFESR